MTETERKQEQRRLERLRRVQQVSEMSMSPGWKALSDYIASRIAASTRQLIDEKDCNTMRLLQGQIQAWEQTVSYVNTCRSEAAKSKSEGE